MKKSVLIWLTSLLLCGCGEECKKLAKVSEISFKNSLSKKSDKSSYYIWDRYNPFPINSVVFYDVDNWVSLPSCQEDDGSYYTCFWAMLDSDINIKEGNFLRVRGSNFVIRGNVTGRGKIIFESYDPNSQYDNWGNHAKLIIEGVLGDNIVVELHDNTTIEVLGVTLGGNGGYTDDTQIVEVDCSLELPFSYRDPKTGKNYWYESYK